MIAMLNDDFSPSTSGEPALFGPDSGDTRALNFEMAIEHATTRPAAERPHALPLALDLELYGRDNAEGVGEVF